jgi:hypothetical protein
MVKAGSRKYSHGLGPDNPVPLECDPGTASWRLQELTKFPFVHDRYT